MTTSHPNAAVIKSHAHTHTHIESVAMSNGRDSRTLFRSVFVGDIGDDDDRTRTHTLKTNKLKHAQLH